MNSLFNLARTFTKANGMSKATDKGQKIKIILLSLFSMFGIMIPVGVVAGLVVKIMTETVEPIGCRDFGLELMLYVICLFSLIFGINVLFSELYFANDIEHILPWPLRAYQIVGGKFLAVFQMENVMQFLLLVCCIIGYGIGSNMGIGQWIIAVLGMILLPVLPLVYCGIISILIMGFTRLIRNKGVIQKFTIALTFIILIIVVCSIGSLQSLDIEQIVKDMALGHKSAFKIFAILLPNVSLYVKAVGEGNVGALLLYLAINIVAVGVMLILAEFLYFQGVIGLTWACDNRKVKTLDNVIGKCKEHSVAYAYFIKEIKILLRSPAYFSNCIVSNFIWPIFIYAVYKIKGCSYTLAQLQYMYRENESNMQLLILVGIVGISVIVTALNSISSNSISREGKHFAFMKYIPVSYTIQWNVKALVGAVFSVIGVLIYFIPACILLKIPLWHSIVYVILSVLYILCIAYMGIYVDSIQPKLIWEDELNSLRENYNTFFAMAIAMAFAGIVCIGGYFLLRNIDIWISMLMIFGILVIFAMVIVGLTVNSSVKNIECQEET